MRQDLEINVLKNEEPKTIAFSLRAWNSGVTSAMKLSVSSGWSQVLVMMSDLLQFIKFTKATDLFLIDLMLIRLPVKRLVLAPELILTSPERINKSVTHGLTCLKECSALCICLCMAKKV